jgi:lipoprotein-anchoring transpeptidase ErfK/SrfK
MDRRALLLAAAALAQAAGPAWSAASGRGNGRLNFNSLFTPHQAAGRYHGKETVSYLTRERPGTVIINTHQRYLYYVLGSGKAIRYGIGVGRQGFEWSGVAEIGDIQSWPDWYPPKEMIAREWAKNRRRLPEKMPGGPENPLGARALYLFQGRRDTLYRIHGTNAPETIGQAMSSGCIRMMNQEVIDLVSRVHIGTRVIVI